MDGREEMALLVEQMIKQKPWCDRQWSRVALACAARAIRRGRHLSEAEKINNLADAMDDEGMRDTASRLRTAAEHVAP